MSVDCKTPTWLQGLYTYLAIYLSICIYKYINIYMVLGIAMYRVYIYIYNICILLYGIGLRYIMKDGSKGFDPQPKSHGRNNLLQVSDNSRLCHAPENDLQNAQQREWQSTILQTNQPELMV